jgi:hypothetical protein
VAEVSRSFQGVAADDDAIWLVDGDLLRRMTDLGDLENPDADVVRPLGAGPAVVADGAYWTVVDGQTLTRVDPDGTTQATTVVDDDQIDPPTTEAPVTTGTGVPSVGELGPEEQEVADLFLRWLAAGESIEETAAMIEDGDALLETIVEAQQTAFEPVEHYSGRIESVDLIGDDHAAVTFSVLSQGTIVVTRDGEAVRVDGEWKVSRDTYCSTIALGPTRCPPG